MSSEKIPEGLAWRYCVFKVAEILGIAGKFTAITPAMKLDLHILISSKIRLGRCSSQLYKVI